MATLPLAALSRAPDEAIASKMGATSAPNDRPLTIPERLFDAVFGRNDLSWQDDANCASTDAEVFFPEKGRSTGPAKRVCANCTVQQQCGEYALANHEKYGVWAGMSERDRRKVHATAAQPAPQAVAA